MSLWLWGAAIYNVVWGAVVVLAPEWTFRVLGVDTGAMADDSSYALLIPIWQCVGMIVGVYGLAYAVAARDPLRHWPIVAAGLLGKILGPIGFIDAVFIREVFPISFGFTILTNDLLWWIPFSLILFGAYRHSRWDGTRS
ncbi:MAG: alkyl hydroperoxide reductase [Phycisphaerales bacterium]